MSFLIIKYLLNDLFDYYYPMTCAHVQKERFPILVVSPREFLKLVNLVQNESTNVVRK